MRNWIGDPRAIALLVVMGILLLLCAAFGIILFYRLLRGSHPVKLTVRNVSIGGVFGGYEFSDTLVLFVCYVLTLGLLAGVSLQLRPKGKPTSQCDRAKKGTKAPGPSAAGDKGRAVPAPGAPAPPSPSAEPRP